MLQNSFHERNIFHMDKRKVWLGDTFAKLIFMTKQRNAKFKKIFHRQNKSVYSIIIFMKDKFTQKFMKLKVYQN